MFSGLLIPFNEYFWSRIYPSIVDAQVLYFRIFTVLIFLAFIFGALEDVRESCDVDHEAVSIVL